MRMICTLLLFWVALNNSLKGTDWPRWRGPDGDGLSKEINWNPQALKNSPNIVWESNVGKGHSSVVIADNRLYTTGNRMAIVETDTLFEEVLFCLDANTGREIWSYGHLTSEGDQFPGPQSTPYIDGTSIYTIGRNGQIFCHDVSTGFIRWGRDLVADSLTTLHAWGFSASPIVEGDLVLINAGTSGLALNKQSGDIIWKSENAVNGYASPVIFEHKGKRLAAIQADQELLFVNPANGKINRSYEWVALNDPVILDEGIFLTAGRSGKNKGRMLLKWQEETNKVVWHKRKQDVAFQNWVVINGYAYGIFRNRKHLFECMDPLTGEIKWSENLGEWGALTAAGDKLLFLTGKGELIVAGANPDAFVPISRGKIINLPETGNLSQPRRCFLWTQPVFANGKFYARTTFGNIVCVDMQ